MAYAVKRDIAEKLYKKFCLSDVPPTQIPICITNTKWT